MKRKKNNKTHFDYILKDFEQDSNPKIEWIKISKNVQQTKEHHIVFPPNQVSKHPYIVFIIFVFIKQFKFAGQGEKVAWEIPILYKGIPFILAHRKFGFRIVSNTESVEITKLGLELISQIQKAIPFAEGMIEPLITQTLVSNEITLENEYTKIRKRYIFFREKAKSEFAEFDKRKHKDISNELTNFPNEIHDFINHHNGSQEYLTSGNYYLIAMMDSFFSFLEHILVLALPFIKNKSEDINNATQFIDLNWSGKFKTIYQLNTDIKALKLYECLVSIKEQLRNPLTHGYFEREGNSFLVHVDYIGAIPMTLTKQNNQLKYFFSGRAALSFSDICQCFDECERFLYYHKRTKFAMQYIKSGLPVAFDSNSSIEYQCNMTTRKNFEDFLYYRAGQYDNAANMDW